MFLKHGTDDGETVIYDGFVLPTNGRMNRESAADEVKTAHQQRFLFLWMVAGGTMKPWNENPYF